LQVLTRRKVDLLLTTSGDVMSTNLYSTVLIWAGARGGVAKMHGRQVKLTAAPTIAGLRVAQIDYRPEIGERRVMPCSEAWREMHDREVRAADALLQALTNDPAAEPAPSTGSD
jgi:hypothetical protein